jgi:hypothetical protein
VVAEDSPGRDGWEAVDPEVAEAAADLLDRMRSELDGPDRHDIAGKRADWRLRRAAELLREQAGMG